MKLKENEAKAAINLLCNTMYKWSREKLNPSEFNHLNLIVSALMIDKETAQTAVNILCDFSSNQDKCNSETFHLLQSVVNKLITDYGAERPYTEE